jgi:hypothetical protein
VLVQHLQHKRDAVLQLMRDGAAYQAHKPATSRHPNAQPDPA